MAKHYIIMSSSYTDGVRIALDITEERLLNSKVITQMIQDIKAVCGKDVPLSTHFIETPTASWQSVAEYDPFFEGVEHINTVEEFSAKIKKDRVLNGLDVATYILTKVKCTHLSLEKLVYFAYAEYLCEYHKRLFEDDIYAFAHGPVVSSVYDTYKKSGYQYIEAQLQQSDCDLRTDVKEMPARSRILFARNGAEKLCSIDRTLQKYGSYTAGALVSLTHRKGSPWSFVDSSRPYQIISDDLILAHHHIECV